MGKKIQWCFLFFKGDIFSIPLSHTCVISFLVLVAFFHNNPTMHFMGYSLKLYRNVNVIDIVTALWQWFPTGNDMHTPLLLEIFGSVSSHFLFSQLGRCYWHLVAWSQLLTPYNAKFSLPHRRITHPQVRIVPRLKNSNIGQC